MARALHYKFIIEDNGGIMKHFLVILILFLSCGNQSKNLAKPEECVITTEVCDEIDNNCDGEIDEDNVCENVNDSEDEYIEDVSDVIEVIEEIEDEDPGEKNNSCTEETSKLKNILCRFNFRQ